MHIFDGAMGTQLVARGLALSEVSTAVRTHPHWVQEIHAAYISAGAEILRAATFGVTDEDTAAAAMTLAKQCAGGRAVFASIAPGNPNLRSVVDRLIDSGCEGFVLETFSVREDAAALVATLHALEKRCSDLKLIACVSPHETPPSWTRIAERLFDAGADCVGANCGTGVSSVLSAATAMMVVGPTCVIPSLLKGDPVDAETITGGPWWGVGGCCGTDSIYVEQLVAALRGRRHR